MPLDLTGQRALVVGTAGGIGRATTMAFADADALLTAAGRTEASVVALADAIGAVPAALDMLNEGAIQTFFVEQDPFDHVVIAAASTKTGSVAALPVADAEAAIRGRRRAARRSRRSAVRRASPNRRSTGGRSSSPGRMCPGSARVTRSGHSRFQSHASPGGRLALPVGMTTPNVPVSESRCYVGIENTV